MESKKLPKSSSARTQTDAIADVREDILRQTLNVSIVLLSISGGHGCRLAAWRRPQKLTRAQWSMAP